MAWGGGFAPIADGFGMLAFARLIPGAGFVVCSLYFTKMVVDWFAGRELATAMVSVLGIEHQLQQVFLNLFLNARDAMPSGGWLSVTTRLDGDRVIAEVAKPAPGLRPGRTAPSSDPVSPTRPTAPGQTGKGPLREKV